MSDDRIIDLNKKPVSSRVAQLISSCLPAWMDITLDPKTGILHGHSGMGHIMIVCFEYTLMDERRETLAAMQEAMKP